jgi:hypothetical protein
MSLVGQNERDKMNDLQEQYNELMGLYCDIKADIKRKNKLLFERWKAGGFIIDEDIMSMYPNLGEVIEQLGDNEDDDD